MEARLNHRSRLAGDDVIDLYTALSAHARPAGSVAETVARSECRAWLERDGFEVSETPFSYSAWPGLCATPILGALLMLVSAFAAISVLGSRAANDAIGHSDGVMASSSAAVALIAVAGILVGRFGTSRLHWMRRTSTILQARRGEPAVWLMAHLDSKSQPVSLLTRATGSVAFTISWIGALGAWAISHFFSNATFCLVGLLAACAVSAVPLVLSWVGSNGNGALDNASGVATVLAAARGWPRDVPVGVVITSGEELGLAGARAWAAGRPRHDGGIAINCDGVDDVGAVTVTLGRRRARRGKWDWGSSDVTKACGPDVRVRRVLPGVLLDAVALTDAGWAACTVSKGGLRSLARVHTRRDTIARTSGSGIAETAQKIVSLGGAIIA